MSFFFNKASHTAAAVVISSLSLAGMAWATFDSGYDAGRSCTSWFASQAGVGACCDGACGDMHDATTDYNGWNLCDQKCKSCWFSSCGVLPATPA